MRKVFLLYLTLLSVALHAEADATNGIHEFRVGAGVILYASDYDSLEDFENKVSGTLDKLSDLGVTHLSLNWPVFTHGVRSNMVFEGQLTPNLETLSRFIELSHQQGYVTMFRPIIDEQAIVKDGPREWRGTIRPQDPHAWFDSYTSLIMRYARLAEALEVDSLIVGTELTSMETHVHHWSSLIANVREVYTGELSYSSNRGISAEIPWELLDFIGVDAFFDLATPNPHRATASDMEVAWEKWVEEITRKADQIGLPLVLTEIGVPSQQGAHQYSWRWSTSDVVDVAEQRRFYESACSAWLPHINGLYWWAVTIWQPHEPLYDVSYTPLGKPAEEWLDCQPHNHR